MESLESRIEKMRAALRAEYGPDCEAAIAQIDRELEAQMQQDPLLVYASNLFYKANLALKKQRIDVARRQQSNGVEENRKALDLLLWDSRLIDFFVANLRPGEKLIKVEAFALVTNMRSRSRAELKRACRMVSEINDQMYEKNFTGDAAVREAEARANYREQPIAPGSRGMVSNSDWPHR